MLRHLLLIARGRFSSPLQHGVVLNRRHLTTATGQDDPSTSGSDSTIAVTHTLQDLFVRLAQGQQKTEQRPRPQHLVHSEEVHAAARPRNEDLLNDQKHKAPPPLLPDDFATIAYAFGRAHHYHRLWHIMASLLVKHPDQYLYQMTPAAMTKLLWGYAQVKVQEPQLFRELAHNARLYVRSFTPRQLADVTWAFAELRFTGAHSLLSLVAQQAEARMQDFEHADLVKLLKALGDMGELKLAAMARFLPVLTNSVAGLKTESVLQALGAVAAALPAEAGAVTDEAHQVAKFLSVAAPILAKRADATHAEWQRKMGQEAQARDLLWLLREWQDWVCAMQVYQRAANPQDRAVVETAVARLERLVQEQPFQPLNSLSGKVTT